MAKGNLEAAVSFDSVKANDALENLLLIAKSASNETWPELSPNLRRRDSRIGMKSVIQNHGWHMRGILTDYVYESPGFASRPGLIIQSVEQTTLEMLETLRLMCDELQKYLEVVPGVVQKQLLLCETADVMVKQMRSKRMYNQADSAVDAIKDVLGHVVSS